MTQGPDTPPGAGRRWYERAVTYPVAAFAMIVIGVVLAILADNWIPALLLFVAAWVACFFLGLVLSKVVRDRIWFRQSRAAVLFVAAVVVSYLPVLVYREGVGDTLLFPLMAVLQGIGTASGFYAPWLYGGKASHRDIEDAEAFLAAIEGRGK